MVGQQVGLCLGSRADVTQDVEGIILANQLRVGLLELQGQGLDRGDGGESCGLAVLALESGLDEGNGVEVLGLLQFVAGDISQVVVFFVFFVPEQLVGLALDEGQGAVGLGLISHLTII